jgi:hypothetical protein
MTHAQRQTPTSPDQLTAAALSSFEGCPDPRLREIMQALVRHLHGFIGEVNLTPAEWSAAVEILTRTGHMSDAHRQEFILWSDTLGASPAPCSEHRRRADRRRRAGPVGRMLELTGRHPWRPAHIHMIVRADGYRPVTTHIFDGSSEYLGSDAVFAVKPSLVREFITHPADDPDTPPGISGEWVSVENELVLASVR